MRREERSAGESLRFSRESEAKKEITHHDGKATKRTGVLEKERVF